MLRRFLKDKSGQIALSVSLLAIPLMGTVGLAVDYSMMYSVEAKLQKVADNAALASTKELTLSTSSNDQVLAVADHFVETEFSTNASDKEYVKINTSVNADNSGVDVELAYYWRPFFAHVLDRSALPIVVKSSAVRAGSESVCVIALEASGAGTMLMGNKSSVTAPGCAVQVNSTDKSGLGLVSGATMAASNVYVSGGYRAALTSFKMRPIVDSPQLPDPLADRVAPKAGMCDYKNYTAKAKNVTLNPGTYCGGISAKGNVSITLNPGVYILKDGPLALKSKGELRGDGVSLVFEGEKAVMDIGVPVTVNLKAAKSGPTAGILIFEDRSASKGRTFSIRSKYAERIEGVIYLPNGKLYVDKESKVGQASKWSAIVARQIELGVGPAVQINSDYGGSDVPVPDGIGGSGAIRLTN